MSHTMRELVSMPMNTVPHPAKFSAEILNVIADGLMDWGLAPGSQILDPFGGVGYIHELRHPNRGKLSYDTHAIELELEWAIQSSRRGPTWCGDFFEFADTRLLKRLWWPVKFDAVITSPTYGNRMADNHNAKDKSKRITYKHKLGRDLTEGNSGQMQWGRQYKSFHRRAWSRLPKLLVPDCLVVLNVKNHVRLFEEVDVVGWHQETMEENGFEMVHDIEVEVRGMGFGQNRNARAECEHVMVFRRAA